MGQSSRLLNQFGVGRRQGYASAPPQKDPGNDARRHQKTETFVQPHVVPLGFFLFFGRPSYLSLPLRFLDEEHAADKAHRHAPVSQLHAQRVLRRRNRRVKLLNTSLNQIHYNYYFIRIEFHIHDLI